MQYISYIKIQNFKVFGEEITIHFDNTTVLIGPNNAGKTTVIQALALWQLGIRAFFDNKTLYDDKTNERKYKGKIDTKTGLGINRRDIEQVPNTDTRQLFNKSRIRTGKENEQIQLTVGLMSNHETFECAVTFKYFKSEVIYCYLNGTVINNIKYLELAANLQVNLLYPMSGLEREETVLQDGAIRKLIGRGITAGLLRNICYNLYLNSENDWSDLVNWMEKLFYIRLENPRRLANDDLILEYNYLKPTIKNEKPLDILQAGRGQLQMLLILAFVMWRRNSVILIDEPDAHLEVLRQSQVMEILNTSSIKYGNQIIMATHSEVIMNETKKLTFLLNGKNIDLNEEKKKVLKSSLKEFGIEQYYKAEISKSILYLEGTTDKQNLIMLAEFLRHPVAALLTDKIFVYYTQSPDIEHQDYEIRQGYYSTHKKHFQAIAPIVPSLKGYALFDSDNELRSDEDSDNGLKIRYWKSYELENYFITPDSVLQFVKNYFKQSLGDLFMESKIEKFKTIFQNCFITQIFDKDNVLVDLYNSTTSEQQFSLYKANSKNKKVSKILEDTFEQFRDAEGELILRKGEFYQIIDFCRIENIDEEVQIKLDEILTTIKIE
jgi:predicted ATPase